jgi:hypothetical protein
MVVSGDAPLNAKRYQSNPLKDKEPAAEKHPHAPSSDATEYIQPTPKAYPAAGLSEAYHEDREFSSQLHLSR